MDAYNTFLQGDLYEKVYMDLPDGFCKKRGESGVSFTHISLYASCQWNLKLIEALLQGGYEQSQYEYSLFTKRHDDDNRVQKFLHQNFKMKDFGELKYFLGIKFMCSSEGVVLNQRKYVLELLQGIGLEDARLVSMLLEQNQRLTFVEYDEFILGGCNDDELYLDVSKYQRLIGRLLYLTNMWPDISYTVQHLSQFMHKPKKSHFDAAIKIVRYIKKDPGQGVLLATSTKLQIVAYCDPNWGTCPMTRKVLHQTWRFAYFVEVKKKKQNTVSLSSAEAEYRNIALTIVEIIWLSGLFGKVSLDKLEPTTLFCDSQATLQIAANPVFHERTKHIEIDCHFVLEKNKRQLVKTQHICTSEQIVDLMTKALGVHQHEYLLSKLRVKDLYHPPT
ncbi:retrovirus-related Pol polyprotein from transposon TNT 1-94 [Gossypium australe]|uniref:Retrovirus-related Pol polyprotein from transposon TNT 1-94 n=1 Tax=Gossypium australe TaxID=47621 RepID=A0A5B6UPS6_9ROSI|nr:retrovirus-related Pol polyprotein from transposon TNT 1-94 [Gossypium australe]